MKTKQKIFMDIYFKISMIDVFFGRFKSISVMIRWINNSWFIRDREFGQKQLVLDVFSLVEYIAQG